MSNSRMNRHPVNHWWSNQMKQSDSERCSIISYVLHVRASIPLLVFPVARFRLVIHVQFSRDVVNLNSEGFLWRKQNGERSKELPWSKQIRLMIPSSPVVLPIHCIRPLTLRGIEGVVILFHCPVGFARRPHQHH